MLLKPGGLKSVIAGSASTPFTMAGTSPSVWWDFSSAVKAWADTAATVPATNGFGIARIDDASGNANNGTQATVGAQPLWYSAGYITTDGTDDRIGRTSYTWSDTQTIIVVLKSLSTTSTTGRLFARGAVNGIMDASGTLKWAQDEAGALVSTGINIRSAAKVVTIVRSTDSDAVIRVNGVQVATFDPNAIEQTSLSIGTQASGVSTSPCATQCWQMALWNRVLGSIEMSEAEHYLGAKAGLSW